MSSADLMMEHHASLVQIGSNEGDELESQDLPVPEEFLREMKGT